MAANFFYATVFYEDISFPNAASVYNASVSDDSIAHAFLFNNKDMPTHTFVDRHDLILLLEFTGIPFYKYLFLWFTHFSDLNLIVRKFS
jgi:hypothetical protein